MIFQNIFNHIDNISISDKYRYWNDFMEHKVTFILEDSPLHARSHCRRVLFFALKLSEKMRLTEREIEILCLSVVFHDSRRQDEGLDKGHGLRAAEYYGHYCTVNNLDFIPEVDLICAYHDCDDSEGVFEISNLLENAEACIKLYRVFKDSDALDRFRLGLDGLDIRFLRNCEALELVELAKEIQSKLEFK